MRDGGSGDSIRAISAAPRARDCHAAARKSTSPRNRSPCCARSRRAPAKCVTRDELFEQVWPRAVVTEASLATCIQELRTALQDDARHPRYIETMHRRGYRFIFPAVVEEAEDDAVPVVAPPELIVGRDAAIGQLAGALEPARAGARQVVFISGEAGHRQDRARRNLHSAACRFRPTRASRAETAWSATAAARLTNRSSTR